VLQTLSGAYAAEDADRRQAPEGRPRQGHGHLFSAVVRACKEPRPSSSRWGSPWTTHIKGPQGNAALVKLAGEDAGIPVTVIGKKVIGGFDEAALRAAAGK
jgi:hypothetical protein